MQPTSQCRGRTPARTGSTAVLGTWALLSLLVAVVASQPHAIAAADSATLPTPFSAAEIRDGWPEGFWLDTRQVTPQGERISRTIVTRWGQEDVTMVDVEFDGATEPTAEQISAATPSTTTWDELEAHARFDTSRSSRERHRRTTALGVDLDGWLYRVEGRQGGVSWFFFADDFPGSPVFYWQTKDGLTLFEAEQVARKLVP
ncbi:MAG: hypothetical protein R3E84_00050 [Pseudomonadales bacterium]